MTAVTSGEIPSLSEHKLILASRVEHVSVFDAGGEKIGHVDDLSIDRLTGQVVYAIVSFGGFLGIGERFHPLPWNALDYDPGRSGYVVSLDKAKLEAAPHYSAQDLEALGGERHREHAATIYDYYGYMPPMGW